MGFISITSNIFKVIRLSASKNFSALPVQNEDPLPCEGGIHFQKGRSNDRDSLGLDTGSQQFKPQAPLEPLDLVPLFLASPI